jgi:hypothetical protein
MSIKGIGGKRQHDHLRECKAMAMVAGMIVLPEVKLLNVRKKRTVETKPRNQPEALLRKDVIAEIRKRNGKVWRIESALSAYRGMPDLCFFLKNKFYFCELKAKPNKLEDEQLEFQLLCLEAGVNHLVVWDLEQIKKL